MTKLYKVFYTGYSASDVDQLSVRRKWGLPGIECSDCDEVWSATGVAYPSVDLSSFEREEQYRKRWPVSLREFAERVRAISSLLPKGSVLSPGTEFGPLEGTGRGSFGDFVWVNPWTLLVQPTALEQLKQTEVKLPKSVTTRITFKKANVTSLVELEIEPRVMMSASSFFPSSDKGCKACGRDPLKLAHKISILGSSIPSDIDIFRDSLFTTLIFATDRFVEAVNNLKLSGLEFEEVDVT